MIEALITEAGPQRTLRDVARIIEQSAQSFTKEFAADRIIFTRLLAEPSTPEGVARVTSRLRDLFVPNPLTAPLTEHGATLAMRFVSPSGERLAEISVDTRDCAP